MEWTIQDLGALGEFLGSVMVLVTLVYLALQVRQSRGLLEENRRISLSQAYGMRTGHRLNWHEKQLDSDVAEILAKIGWRYSRPADNDQSPADYELEALTPVESIKLRNLMQMQVIQIDHSLYQASLGLLDEDLTRNIEVTIARLFQFWNRLNISVPPRVQHCYESQIKKE